MSNRNLLEQLKSVDWKYPQHIWLHKLNDLVNRPVISRVTASTNATAVALNGSAQSTGIGAGKITPLRYAEITVKARVTFNISGAGTLYVYVYRTLGTIPANGAAPNGGDVIVGGDAFAGPATVGGQNLSASFSFLDSGLSTTKQYSYYLAFKGTNTLTGNLVNNSQLLCMERS